MGPLRYRILERLVALAAVLTAAWPARAQPNPDGNDEVEVSGATMTPEVALQRAISFYEAGRYEECVSAFSELLRPDGSLRPRDSASVERARVYSAACLMALGNLDGADEQFRVAIRDNPQIAVPSAVVFPQTVVDRFILVRASLLEEIRKADEERARRIREEAELARRQAEIERQRLTELERLAKQETVVIKNQRWIASVPFGVGQFQNEDYFLGGVFLVLETGLIATAITATAIQLSLHEQVNGGRNAIDPAQTEQLNEDLATANTVALAATGGFLLTAALGIVEAHLSFEPERREGVRQRRSRGEKTQRPAVTLRPEVSGREDGAFLGVRGRF